MTSRDRSVRDEKAGTQTDLGSPTRAGSPTEASPAPSPSLREDLATAGYAAVAVGLVLAVAAFWALMPHGAAVAAAGGWLALVAAFLTVVDLRTHRLPNRFVGAGTLGALLLLVLAAATGGGWAPLGRAVAAGAVCLVAYFVLALLRAGGLGLGDVKLAGLLGLWLGWFGWSAALTGVLAGFVLGGVYAVGLLVTRRATRTTAIAFGPWMLLGAAVVTALIAGGGTGAVSLVGVSR
ncbi:prepilin peptidase [Georgenia yuyongxinii]|nr:prepilin peptidase [Georgenia yuyongxinii]